LAPSHYGKNSVEKFLDPDIDPNQRQNRFVVSETSGGARRKIS